jgi:HSP20 family protein
VQKEAHQPTHQEKFNMTIVRYSYPSFRTLSPVLNGFGRSPWSGLETEIDRLFQSAVGDFGAAPSNRFPVDLYEDKDNTYVRAELPGFNRTDINVEMVDGYLTISAVRKTTAVPAQNGEAQPEDSFTLTRSVSINDEVQTDKVSAAYENGVLTVTLPKREETKPRKVTVAVK